MEFGSLICTSQLDLPTPKSRAVHPNTLFILLGNPEIWHHCRHDPSRIRSWHQGVPAEILHAFVVAQKILV